MTALASLGACSPEEGSFHPRDLPAFMHGYAEDASWSMLPSSPMSKSAYASTQPTTRPAVLTLGGVIEECLKQNFAIRSANEDVNQALADVWTASLLPNPQVTLDTVLQPFNRSTLRPTNPSGPPEYDVLVQYPIDWLLFGKREIAIQVAKHAANAAAATRTDQIRQQIAAAISSFYDVLYAKASLALTEEDLTQNEKLLEITEKRVGLGGVGNVELDRVRVQLITARQTVDQTRRTVVAAKSSLRALLGRVDPDQSFDVIGTLEVPSRIAAIPFDELMNRARENRPDLLALEYKVQQAKADVTNQQAMGWPQISITAGYSLQEQVPIGARNTSEWSASLQSTIPIFDHNQGNVRKAKSAALQALLNLKAGEVQASTDIEQALDAFEASHHILEENGATLIESARQARDKLQKGYAAGGYALIDVLNAQADYRNALRTDLALRTDFWRSLHRLNAAVGTRILP